MPAFRALLAQVSAALLSAAVALLLARSGWHEATLFEWAVLQGMIAAGIAWRLRADRWWLPLHLAFVPSIISLRALPVPPFYYLTILVVLLLIYGLPFRSQVPLFLSSRRTIATLAAWLPARPLTVLDVGSGTGRFVRALALARADCRVTGFELAPLPWWWSHLRTHSLPNAQVQRLDFWTQSLADYDVIYAFLSPVPMPALWQKVLREMRDGSWLVSNSFAVPDAVPTEVLQVDDARQTRLYCYRIVRGKDQPPA